MEANRIMKKLLQETGIQLQPNFDEFHPILKKIADSELIKVEDCFLLKALLGDNCDIQSTLSDVKELLKNDDRTGLECSLNNIYVVGIVYSRPYEESVNELFILKQGIKYAFYLAEKIRACGHFRIILSFSSGCDPDCLVDCSVRFHLVREEESWLSENIDVYSDESILVLDT